MKTVEEVLNDKSLYHHHTASRFGYESRRGNGHVEEYNGRFGKGYIINCFSTLGYNFICNYRLLYRKGLIKED